MAANRENLKAYLVAIFAVIPELKQGFVFREKKANKRVALVQVFVLSCPRNKN